MVLRFTFSEHSFLILQLHGGTVLMFPKSSFFLYAAITDFMSSEQGKLTFTLFLLKILWSLLSFGKFLSTNCSLLLLLLLLNLFKVSQVCNSGNAITIQKNFFTLATFALTFLLNGGLSHIIFQSLFFVCFSSSFLHSSFVDWKSFLRPFPDFRLLIY